jgi:hypothetical protein
MTWERDGLSVGWGIWRYLESSSFAISLCHEVPYVYIVYARDPAKLFSFGLSVFWVSSTYNPVLVLTCWDAVLGAKLAADFERKPGKDHELICKLTVGKQKKKTHPLSFFVENEQGETSSPHWNESFAL